MKNKFKFILYILIASFLFTYDLKAEVPCIPGDEECDPGQAGQGTGRPAPINDYAGVLIASGFIAASAIYFKKEQLIKKNK